MKNLIKKGECNFSLADVRIVFFYWPKIS